MARRVKGEGSIYQRHSDGRWFYCVDLGWQGPAGARKRDRRTVSASTLKALRPKMKALDEQVRANLDADGSMTVERWLTWWLAEIAPITAKSPRTLATYRGYVDNWLVPHIGRKRLDRLRPDDLRALYRTMREAGKSAATIRQVHAIASKALKQAEDDGKILRSPAKSVTPPGGDKGSHGKLTMDEARAVMRVLANRPDRARWYAALLLGLRQGEALGLAWDDVDTDAGVIHVRQSLGRVKGAGLQLGPVKSQASRRALPLLPEVAAAMADVPRVGPLVWGPKDNRADYNVWQGILKEAGVPPRALHAARASTASILSELGVPAKIIAEILGHAQTSTTEAHYIHGDHVIHLKALGDMTRALEG